MKNKLFKPQPNLEERLDQVNERIRRARWRLDWQTREARIPLDIQEDVGVSKLEGDVMLVSRDGVLRDKVRNLIHSEGYGCDISERSTSAVGLLKLGKYQMIIADYTRRSRGRLFEYVRRYQPHVKIVSVVRNDYEGRRVMRAGGYSYLLGRGFDPEQLRTCIISALKLQNDVCWLLANGERCNRSCVDNFEPEEEFRIID